MKSTYKNIKTVLIISAMTFCILPLTAIAQEDGEEQIEVFEGGAVEIILVDGVEVSNEDKTNDNPEEKSSPKEDEEESVYEIRQRVERAQKERLELLKLLGSVYKEINKTDEATEMFKKALDMDPTDNDLFKIVLEQYQESGKWDELIPIYQKLIDKYKGDNVEYYQRLFDLYMKTNNEDKAFETIENYLNEHESKEATYIYAVDVYIYKDRKEDAVRIIEKGLAKFPDNISINSKAADIYTIVSDYPKALEYLEKARNLATNSESKDQIERKLMYLYEKADIIKDIVSKKTAELQKVEGELKNLYVKQAKAKEETGKSVEAVAIYKKLQLLAPGTPEGTLAAKKIKELESKIENK